MKDLITESRKHGIKIFDTDNGRTVEARRPEDNSTFTARAMVDYYGLPATPIYFWMGPRKHWAAWNQRTDAVSNNAELFLLLQELRGT